jgi:hypothetical protein
VVLDVFRRVLLYQGNQVLVFAMQRLNELSPAPPELTHRIKSWFSVVASWRSVGAPHFEFSPNRESLANVFARFGQNFAEPT